MAIAAILAGACASGSEDRKRRPVGPSASTTAKSTSTSAAASTITPPTSTPATAVAAPVVPAQPPPTRVARVPAQPATPSCPAVPARAVPRSDRSSYKLMLDVRLAENAVFGEQAVRFTPDLDTDQVVFRLWANAPRIARAGGHIDVFLEGASQPDPTTIVVPRAIRAGETVELSMTWRLTLPGAVDDRISRSGDAVRLGSFFPILAWDPGLGWAREPPTSGFAEASLSVPSDFDVKVVVADGLSVLATGVSDSPGHWAASAVPDFALSVGRFAIASREVDAGAGPVSVTVGVHDGVGESPGPYLDKLDRVLRDFGARFGAYPWPSYSLAITPQLAGGIEYPMHVMQGPGKLGRTTSHEVGHMWFYGLVSTNQGTDPWIDEGLASYAEARFEGTLASMQSTTIPAGGKGRAGEPMTFWESRQSIYYRSVYVQGAAAVAALGPADVVDCALRHLVARNSFHVTRNADVIAALSVVFPNAPEVLARYGIRA